MYRSTRANKLHIGFWLNLLSTQLSVLNTTKTSYLFDIHSGWKIHGRYRNSDRNVVISLLSLSTNWAPPSRRKEFQLNNAHEQYHKRPDLILLLSEDVPFGLVSYRSLGRDLRLRRLLHCTSVRKTKQYSSSSWNLVLLRLIIKLTTRLSV